MAEIAHMKELLRDKGVSPAVVDSLRPGELEGLCREFPGDTLQFATVDLLYTNANVRSGLAAAIVHAFNPGTQGQGQAAAALATQQQQLDALAQQLSVLQQSQQGPFAGASPEALTQAFRAAVGPGFEAIAKDCGRELFSSIRTGLETVYRTQLERRGRERHRTALV